MLYVLPLYVHIPNINTAELDVVVIELADWIEVLNEPVLEANGPVPDPPTPTPPEISTPEKAIIAPTV